jgi:hypothetical protein
MALHLNIFLGINQRGRDDNREEESHPPYTGYIRFIGYSHK